MFYTQIEVSRQDETKVYWVNTDLPLKVGKGICLRGIGAGGYAALMESGWWTIKQILISIDWEALPTNCRIANIVEIN